ncbi:hypothetical protein ABIA35_009494 [Catenulispora sp. MAP12-49]
MDPAGNADLSRTVRESHSANAKAMMGAGADAVTAKICGGACGEAVLLMGRLLPVLRLAPAVIRGGVVVGAVG